MEHHEVPLIYVSVIIPAGAINDGVKYGLSSLTADALLDGSRNYTKKKIEESLEFIGASYRASASKEFTKITVSFVNTDQDIVFPILKDIITNPIFDEQEFFK